MQFAHLYSYLFNPSKNLSILVPKKLIDHLHCFQNVYHEAWFTVSEICRSQRGQVRRRWGMQKNFKAAVGSSSHRNLEYVSSRIVRTPRTILSILLRAISDQDVSIRLHITYRLWYDLNQDSQL
jgi:hypothetical protein